MEYNKKYRVENTDEEWRRLLTDKEYRILRKQGTERPHSGEYNNHFESGTYNCAGCGQPLYKSNAKFESGCGWPSYDASIKGSIEYRKDTSYGMIRVEIICSQCGSHQGHVFDDETTRSGKRYCVNSTSIKFESEKSK